MRSAIDINCDMGEGLDNDAQLMPYIHSANIACGYHAGDEHTLRTVMSLALQHGVNIGAHVSYADRENFGRKEFSLSESETYILMRQQLLFCKIVADKLGATIAHVKPHGALYNQSAKDATLARVIAQAVKDFDPNCILFGLSGSVSISEAEKVGVKTFSEVFADRTYQSDGSLTPRSNPNAMHHTVDAMEEHVTMIVNNSKVKSTDGSYIDVKADTICVHGDGVNAVPFAKAVFEIIERNRMIKDE